MNYIIIGVLPFANEIHISNAYANPRCVFQRQLALDLHVSNRLGQFKRPLEANIHVLVITDCDILRH